MQRLRMLCGWWFSNYLALISDRFQEVLHIVLDLLESLYLHSIRTHYMQCLAAPVRLNNHQMHIESSRNPDWGIHKGCVAVLPFAGIADTRVCEEQVCV